MVIDLHILNASIHEESVFESLPMFIIELINNLVVLEKAIAYAYLPVTICALNILSGMYHIVYYRIYRKINIVDIPIKIEVMSVVLINMNEVIDNRVKTPVRSIVGIHSPDAESGVELSLTSSVSTSSLQRIVDLEKSVTDMDKSNDKRFTEITERLTLLEKSRLV